MDYDEYWTFHMTQKISFGEMPYKEINMIVTPLFYQIGAVIFKIFGDSFIVYKLYGAAIGAALVSMFYLVSNEISKNEILNNIFLFAIIFLSRVIYITNYNVLIIVFLLLALLLELKRIKSDEKNKYDLFIGITLALAFFTKQTLGGVAFACSMLYLLVECLFYKEKGFWKNVLFRILGFFIIFIPYIVWFALSGALYNFIDFGFLGMLDFAEKNSKGNLRSIMMTWNYICVLTGFIFAFNKKVNDKRIMVLTLYTLASLTMIIPLTNTYHTIIASSMPLILILGLADTIFKNGYRKTAKFISIIVLLVILYAVYIYAKQWAKLYPEIWQILHFAALIIVFALIIYFFIKNKSKECFILVIAFFIINSIYNLTIWSSIVAYDFVPKGLEVYKYCGYKLGDLTDIYAIDSYIKNKEDEGYNVYIMSADASKYMIPLKRNNFKYDLLLQGNLGYKGEEKVIGELKQLKNPLILKREKLIFQESKIVDKYIKENYKKVTNINDFDVYEVDNI
jgi:hypothetical protein